MGKGKDRQPGRVRRTATNEEKAVKGSLKAAAKRKADAAAKEAFMAAMAAGSAGAAGARTSSDSTAALSAEPAGAGDVHRPFERAGDNVDNRRLCPRRLCVLLRWQQWQMTASRRLWAECALDRHQWRRVGYAAEARSGWADCQTGPHLQTLQGARGSRARSALHGADQERRAGLRVLCFWGGNGRRGEGGVC